ncbi:MULTISPECIES: cytochrome f [unclassified Tolypothrix]|uniref:cytochrome f n=1 Tax=unclassified Tolypothrix TaxID=2649714 RepID=UPI0005EABCE4|nr:MULTISPECIES: apocytochrome f [unclassified Tolypothrix]BAY90072.1 cytochrome f [Microchaete diplosiphon NIES-3275]EKE97444.1 plastoquinol--plastocyanin [Tolypothrix sp. PCC 7601]MBE9086108.1 apocytochrome f [Tolypothrix sp. LEGE 11397]UYD24293.1 apocytochrome f [Tolypothrix sp. PCC 7712]UYD33476.1 apocytochrome f [Tolypothrix sp. PCC 7601]
MRNASITARFTRSTRAIVKTLLIAIATVTFYFTSDLALPQSAAAYPFWAQQTYPETPREPTGRIVCANCHLAAKPTEVEVPQSVLPDTVFKAVVKIPYDTSVQQVGADGSKTGLNVGAVLMLPEGFKIAPEDRISEELKEEVGDTYFQTYSEDQENVVIVGPLPGEQYQEIIFPVLSPNPATDKNIHFGKYSVHVGGNRGRGQVYPTGEKSNNSVYNASAAGTITKIAKEEDGDGNVKYVLSIKTDAGEVVSDTIPLGPELIVSEGQTVKAGDALTNNPNVGGFGQKDAEIVLQDASRVKWLIAFIALVMLAQVMLVLKKKQVEKVQAAEMNF